MVKPLSEPLSEKSDREDREERRIETEKKNTVGVRWAEVSLKECVLYEEERPQTAPENLCSSNDPQRDRTCPAAKPWQTYYLKASGVYLQRNKLLHRAGKHSLEFMVDNRCYIMQTNKRNSGKNSWHLSNRQQPEVHFTSFLSFSASHGCIPINGESSWIIWLFENVSKPSQTFPSLTFHICPQFKVRQPSDQAAAGLLTVLPGHMEDKKERVSCGGIVTCSVTLASWYRLPTPLQANRPLLANVVKLWPR